MLVYGLHKSNVIIQALHRLSSHHPMPKSRETLELLLGDAAEFFDVPVQARQLHMHHVVSDKRLELFTLHMHYVCESRCYARWTTLPVHGAARKRRMLLRMYG